MILGILLALQVAGLTYAGLSPFSFSPENRVEAMGDDRGLKFDGVGIATSEGWLRSASDFPEDAVTFHLLIRPDAESDTGLGTVLTLEDETSVSPLIVAQWKSWLIMRVRDPERAKRGYWEMDAAGFTAGKRRMVTITSAPGHGTIMYVDGIATGDMRTRTLISDGQPLDGRLLLGCLGNGSAGWRGELLGIAIVADWLDDVEVAAHHALVVNQDFAALGDVRELVALYDFAEIDRAAAPLLHTVENRVTQSEIGALEVPENFAPLRPEVFGVPPLRDLKADWFVKDLLRNIAGFIPLGFVAGLILIRNRNAPGIIVTFQVAMVGLLLSLGIESIQIALPMRSSSLSDLSLNGIGALIGAIIALAFRHTRLGTG